jgi:hypothetical protein
MNPINIGPDGGTVGCIPPYANQNHQTIKPMRASPARFTQIICHPLRP